MFIHSFETNYFVTSKKAIIVYSVRESATWTGLGGVSLSLPRGAVAEAAHLRVGRSTSETHMVGVLVPTVG